MASGRSELSASQPAVQGVPAMQVRCTSVALSCNLYNPRPSPQFCAVQQQAARAERLSPLEELQASARLTAFTADYSARLRVEEVSDDALEQMGVQPHIFRSWHQQATSKRPFLHQNLEDFVADGFDAMYEMDQDPDDFWTLDFEEWGLTKEAAEEAKDILRGDWGYYDVGESIWLGSLIVHYQHVVAADTWHR